LPLLSYTSTTNLKSPQDIDIKPNQNVQDFLTCVMDWVRSKPISRKAIRDDQASILVLACANIREISAAGLTNINKYLFNTGKKSVMLGGSQLLTDIRG